MSISVTCPSCLKRFSVSDKFAGKEGPCPNCQKPIKIPERADEVVIHAPKASGPTDSKGKSVLKPIKRSETKIGVPVIVGGVVAAVAIFAIAAALGFSGQQPPTALLVAGALVAAAPLAFLGYWFLHDDELEGYNGRQLLARCGIVTIAFAALWLIYGFVPKFVLDYESMAEYSGLVMVIFLPIMIAIGAAVSVLVLELEVAQGAMHAVFYVGVTLVLAWLAGAQLSEPMSGGGASTANPRPAVAPSETPPANAEPPREIPKILQ